MFYKLIKIQYNCMQIIGDDNLRHIYTSLDIGTDTIKIIVSELYHGKVNLLASSSVKSKGIKKGIVTDVEEASSSLMMAIEEVETKLGIKVKEVITSPGGATF